MGTLEIISLITTLVQTGTSLLSEANSALETLRRAQKEGRDVTDEEIARLRKINDELSAIVLKKLKQAATSD